jgi:hypothetical protein
MPEYNFLESELRFTFPKDWIVYRYDEHRFYRYLSGSGLKGVDFIAVHQEELILIEVKNYATRFEKKDYDPMEILLTNPAYYIKRYRRKFEDTLRLLDIINQYYNRKWWYRKLFQPFKSYFSKSSILKRETGFWSKAIEISQKKVGVKLILWLELAPNFDNGKAKNINDYFQKEIQSKFPTGMEFIIANSHQPYGGIIAQFEKV